MDEPDAQAVRERIIDDGSIHCVELGRLEVAAVLTGSGAKVQ